MKLLGTKLLVTTIKEENKWSYEDKEEVKLGKVVFDFKGENVQLKKGDDVYYQYGSNIKLEGVEYVLVSESNLICQK